MGGQSPARTTPSSPAPAAQVASARAIPVPSAWRIAGGAGAAPDLVEPLLHQVPAPEGEQLGRGAHGLHHRVGQVGAEPGAPARPRSARDARPGSRAR